MSNNKLKLLEIVTNKLNPPYKKEIIPLKNLDISDDLIEKAKKYNINLRGIKKPLIIEDEDSLKELPNFFVSDFVLSIVKIDDNTLAFGGRDSKVTIVDISNKDEPKTISSVSSNGMVWSIVKIDNNTLAFGGRDGKVTIVDIRDKANPKIISTLFPLEDEAYEVLSDDSWCFINPKGWHINNDPLLYRYARLYDPKSKELVPYYMLEKRITISDDNKEVCIARKKNQ